MIIATWISYLALLAVAWTAAITDLRTGRVPNSLTYPAILAGLIWWPVAGFIAGDAALAGELSKSAWLAMLSGLLPYAALVLAAGLGGGDMKLMAAIGAISGRWEVVLATTVYALIAALVMAIWIMARRGVVRQTLARVFSAALLASSRVKPEFPKDGPTVAFAAAIAIGVTLAGAEQLLGLDTPWRAFTP